MSGDRLDALKFIAREVAAYGDCNCQQGEGTCVYCTAVNLHVLGDLGEPTLTAEDAALRQVKSDADRERKYRNPNAGTVQPFPKGRWT